MDCLGSGQTASVCPIKRSRELPAVQNWNACCGAGFVLDLVLPFDDVFPWWH